MKNRIIIALVAIILILVVALSLTTCLLGLYQASDRYQNLPNTDKNDPAQNEQIDYSNTFDLIHALFSNFSIFEIDYENAMLSAIRAYVEATGDKYAMYYTQEEFEEMMSESNGDLYGIGVQVIFDYSEYFIEVVLIMPDSPAEQHLQLGDKVTHIYIDDQKVSLVDLVEENRAKAREIYSAYTEDEINNIACYETFLYVTSKLRGPEGTWARFCINRNNEELEMEVQRAKVKTLSVTAEKSIRDNTVGIVSISQFNLTTPTQFKECMDKLIAEGCNKFVFDVRNNPGGDVASVRAIVSTFLNEGDTIFSTKDTNGNVEVIKAQEVQYSASSNYSTCNVTKSDIGKYKDYQFVVLTNENSASSAEIFTSVFRDYQLAQIVGTKTYGKGSVQSIISLHSYGQQYYGALKLTTKLYFPACGVGYDGGIGITPNYTVDLEGIATETHFYKLTEEIDNQLQKAVSILID